MPTLAFTAAEVVRVEEIRAQIPPRSLADWDANQARGIPIGAGTEWRIRRALDHSPGPPRPRCRGYW